MTLLSHMIVCVCVRVCACVCVCVCTYDVGGCMCLCARFECGRKCLGCEYVSVCRGVSEGVFVCAGVWLLLCVECDHCSQKQNLRNR